MFKIRKKKSHKHRCQKEKDASTVRNIPYVGQWTKFLGSVVFSCSYHLTCSSLSIFQTSLFDVHHDRYNFKYIIILLSQLLLFLLFSVLQVGTYNTQNHIYRFEISIFRKWYTLDFFVWLKRSIFIYLQTRLSHSWHKYIIYKCDEDIYIYGL